MKYYQDITLMPDAEANLGFLWQKVYQQVHIALADNKIAENESAIAISFPEYGDKGFPLGGKLRLLANEEMLLKQFNVEQWLSRLMDYTHIKPVKEVPVAVSQYACFRRKQFKSNILKEAQRRAKYIGESIEEALQHYKDYETQSSLPFINMNSLSMDGEVALNRSFKLFVEKKIVNEQVSGTFNCYGLSKAATVPCF